jgi:hypothetical protein
MTDMSTIRTLAEPLTIAYIAMGAQTYMQTPEYRHRTTESHEGELDFIGDIIRHARMLDSKADERQDDFSGVFLYEVAEEFGNKLAQRLALMGEASPAFIEGLADALIDSNCR